MRINKILTISTLLIGINNISQAMNNSHFPEHNKLTEDTNTNNMSPTFGPKSQVSQEKNNIQKIDDYNNIETNSFLNTIQLDEQLIDVPLFLQHDTPVTGFGSSNQKMKEDVKSNKSNDSVEKIKNSNMLKKKSERINVNKNPTKNNMITEKINQESDYYASFEKLNKKNTNTRSNDNYTLKPIPEEESIQKSINNSISNNNYDKQHTDGSVDNNYIDIESLDSENHLEEYNNELNETDKFKYYRNNQETHQNTPSGKLVCGVETYTQGRVVNDSNDTLAEDNNGPYKSSSTQEQQTTVHSRNEVDYYNIAKHNIDKHNNTQYNTDSKELLYEQHPLTERNDPNDEKKISLSHREFSQISFGDMPQTEAYNNTNDKNIDLDLYSNKKQENRQQEKWHKKVVTNLHDLYDNNNEVRYFEPSEYNMQYQLTDRAQKDPKVLTKNKCTSRTTKSKKKKQVIKVSNNTKSPQYGHIKFLTGDLAQKKHNLNHINHASKLYLLTKTRDSKLCKQLKQENDKLKKQVRYLETQLQHYNNAQGSNLITMDKVTNSNFKKVPIVKDLKRNTINKTDVKQKISPNIKQMENNHFLTNIKNSYKKLPSIIKRLEKTDIKNNPNTNSRTRNRSFLLPLSGTVQNKSTNINNSNSITPNNKKTKERIETMDFRNNLNKTRNRSFLLPPSGTVQNKSKNTNNSNLITLNNNKIKKVNNNTSTLNIKNSNTNRSSVLYNSLNTFNSKSNLQIPNKGGDNTSNIDSKFYNTFKTLFSKDINSNNINNPKKKNLTINDTYFNNPKKKNSTINDTYFNNPKKKNQTLQNMHSNNPKKKRPIRLNYLNKNYSNIYKRTNLDEDKQTSTNTDWVQRNLYSSFKNLQIDHLMSVSNPTHDTNNNIKQ